MKKTISLFCALACIFSLSAKTIYLIPGVWANANAKFSINYFGGTGITQSFTDFMTVSSDGTRYEATVPDAAENVIFVRHDSTATTPTWGNKWNQTEDQTIGTNNCFTITSWSSGQEGKSTGTWSTYTPTVTPEPEPDTPNTPHDTLRIYCKMTQSWWTTDGAAVGIYCYNSSDAKNATYPGIRMTAVAGETGLWYADVDVTTYTSVIFTRVNGSGTIADWNAKTKDLTIPTDGNNCFTITTATAAWADKNNKCSGEWSTYTPGPTTDNTTVTVFDANAPIYNLLGVQVDSNYKGVVIQHGKKFIQK